jgi:hypothetical protein
MGGIPQKTQYEKYLAFRREEVAIIRDKPTLERRREIWQFVQKNYSHLPVGKLPF